MQGTILYYSLTGNTALAARSIAGRFPDTFELIDVTRAPEVDLTKFDLVGFATPTDFWGVPHSLEAFIESLPPQAGKPSFVLNTFGGVSGKTLRRLGELVSARGFKVIAGHSLHMPDSYPPLMAFGIRAAGRPSGKDIQRFDAFIQRLSQELIALEAGSEHLAVAPPLTVLDRLIPAGSRSAGRRAIGLHDINEATCTKCGACERTCPSDAIHLDPFPVFVAGACRGCWRCVNRCPTHSIRTAAFAGKAHYSGPTIELRARLEPAKGE